MAGVTSRLPSVPLLSQDMPSLLKSVLEDLLKQTVIGETDLNLKKYTQLVLNSIDDDVTGVLSELCSVLSESFYDIMKKKKILFPSALRSNLYLGTNQLLASVDFRKSVSEKFEELNEVESEILNVFVGNVIFSLSKKVLVHCLKVMRGSTENEIEVRMKRSGDRVESREFQELVYYIGGYIVAGYIWKGKGYSANSTTWASFTNVLKQNFRCDRDGQKQCSETVRHFTEERDRGGLTHITNAAFDFFLVTFDVIMQQEGEDGSLPPNIIDEKLLVDDLVLLLWDVAVASELSSDESLDLLIQILTSCVKTVMKGIMNRRLNEELKQSYVSIPLRSKLAGGTSASKSSK